MQKIALLIFGFCALLALTPAIAQVRCTMPNGVVIEQRLSDVCPQGAVKAQTLNGSSAETRQAVRAPEEPMRKIASGEVVQTVSRAEFGKNWPLSVDSVELRCYGRALVFAHDNRIFTINGTAESQAIKNGWLDMGNIWRNNPDIEGTKIPISPLIARAQKLCDVVIPSVSTTQEKPKSNMVRPVSFESDDESGMSGFLWLVVVGGVIALIFAIKGSSAKAKRR